METKIFCKCGQYLNDNGFCPDPECQLDVDRACKNLQKFYAKKCNPLRNRSYKRTDTLISSEVNK
jgi:hypothetical protein